MKNIQNHNILIYFYVILLFSLLLCVSATPLMIRHGISLTPDIIIAEETVETALIVALFGISFLILKSLLHTLRAYRKMVDRVGYEKSKLVSRLAEAFNYIGTVNVEMQEIESVLCGMEDFPQSKRELKARINQLATKSMTIAVVPWLTVRMIDRHSGQTIFEHTVHRSAQGSPSATLGNRQILDGQPVDGLQTIGSRQGNLDLVTVLILPENDLADDRTTLLIAILNQIEMLFMLYRVGCLRPIHHLEPMKKEFIH